MNSLLTISRNILIQIMMCLFIFSFAQARPADHHILNQENVFQKAAASIVVVTGEDAKGQPVSPGNGFFVNDNLIATDYQVIRNAIRIQIQIAGQDPIEARVVGVDSSRSVAILKVSGATLPPLKIACPPEPSVGSKLYFVGNAGRSGGIPSQATVTRTRRDGIKRYLQFNVAVGSGKSGSPVLNKQGEVRGMVVRSAPGEQSSNTVVSAFYLFLSVPEVGSSCDPDKYLEIMIEGAVNRNTRKRQQPPKRVVGGVIGGVEGGIPGGVIGGVEGGIPGVPGRVGSRVDNSIPVIVRKSGGMLAATAIRRAEPPYPRLAQAAGVSGAVVVEVLLDEEGDILSARALSGHPLLKDAAVAAARGWKFTPTTFEGKLVKVVGTITFNFSL
jgi:TonB family protein